MFNLKPTLSFLATQPSITVFHQLTPAPCELQDNNNLLPCLSRATLSPWLIPKLGSCPLKHIYTVTTPELGNVVMEQSFIDTLAVYNRTLTSLTLERYATEESIKLGDFVTFLAESLPLLEELSLWHRGELVSFPLLYINHGNNWVHVGSRLFDARNGFFFRPLYSIEEFVSTSTSRQKLGFFLYGYA
jgi:hypothetical protein